ncbi:putative ribose-5-phosphate isomerase 2 [Vitis vinifera]|uniref:ribose-5-phosphate isomerase n=1 Tax=Vitis vinifera TaxID=29760 RepID=A0A438JUM9_VITVI|nr:putative ribose-5-phosphate isomerase 2 [Vitis vinifera]
MAIAYPHFIGSEKSAMETGIILSPSSPSPSLPHVILTQDELKKIAAYKAVEYVESGMVLGLGTGSTAKHAVDRIGELLRQGKLKNIVGIPTSKKTHEQAVSLGIPWAGWVTAEGEDGGGRCKKFIVIVDESKLVNHLGGSGLAMPVEIVPFCWKFTAQRNYVVDLYFKREIGDLKVASDAILRLAGVVEHGMFLGMATTLIVAGECGVVVKDK